MGTGEIHCVVTANKTFRSALERRHAKISTSGNDSLLLGSLELVSRSLAYRDVTSIIEDRVFCAVLSARTTVANGGLIDSSHGRLVATSEPVPSLGQQGLNLQDRV